MIKHANRDIEAAGKEPIQIPVPVAAAIAPANGGGAITAGQEASK
jgi:hypothetical protein